MKTKIARGVIAGEIIGWGYGFRRVGNFYTFTGISEAPNFYGFTPNFRPNFYKSKILLGALSRTTTTSLSLISLSAHFHTLISLPLSHSLPVLLRQSLSHSLILTLRQVIQREGEGLRLPCLASNKSWLRRRLHAAIVREYL